MWARILVPMRTELSQTIWACVHYGILPVMVGWSFYVCSLVYCADCMKNFQFFSNTGGVHEAAEKDTQERRHR